MKALKGEYYRWTQSPMLTGASKFGIASSIRGSSAIWMIGNSEG
jgi:hypothetical protein